MPRSHPRASTANLSISVPKKVVPIVRELAGLEGRSASHFYAVGAACLAFLNPRVSSASKNILLEAYPFLSELTGDVKRADNT